MNSVSFGFLNEPTNIQWDGDACRISPLADYPQLIADLEKQPGVHEGWWYPPLVKLGMRPDGPCKPNSFSLSATHELVLGCSDASEDLANFLIALFGMLKGRRLQRDQGTHFYKTPLESKLNDFFASDASITRALDAALGFWRKHPDASVRKLAFGAMHWHLFAQLYEHQFERFNAQYMALDTCSKLALEIQLPGYPKSQLQHWERASKLCDATGVPKPVWVNALPGQKTCALAERRNALIHEAMYGGQPVGFAFPSDYPHMELELTGLVARIFLRLLGVHNSYVATACTTLQTQGFD